MHVKVLWIIEEIDAQLFCFEGLNRSILGSHLWCQQLPSISVPDTSQCYPPRTHLENRRERVPYPVDNSSQGPPLFTLWHKSHPFPTTRGSQSHRLRLSTRINRRPFINKILDQLRTTQPNEIRSSTLRPKNIAILVSPLRQAPRKLGFQVNKSMIDYRRTRNEWREVFSARISQDEFMDQVDNDKENGADNHRGLD